LRAILRSSGPVLVGGTLVGDDAYFHVRSLQWTPINANFWQFSFELHETDTSPTLGRLAVSAVGTSTAAVSVTVV